MRLVALFLCLVGITSFATPASAAVTERSVYYTYDSMGRELSARFDSAAGADGIVNTYNGFGDLTASTVTMGGFSKTLQSTYDSGGRRSQLIHPENSSSYTFSYCYDNLGRLTTVAQGPSCTTAPLDSFTYANNGLVAGRGEGSASASSTAYTWDDIGRLLTQADAFTGGTGNVIRTFGYNPASQIVGDARNNSAYSWTPPGASSRAYAVNGLNQYTSAGSTSFSYDANGNLISDGTNTYTYDVENRLVSASAGTVSSSLTYDPSGRLFEVVKQTSGVTNSDTRFVYDGDAMVLEYDASGNVANRYVHGTNAAADDPLVWYAGSTLGTVRFLHPDHEGSIVAVTDGTGAKYAINTYDEYGLPVFSGSQSMNTGRFQYTGQAWLDELNLYYYKARFYSPGLGRFLQTDPIGYKDQINLYEYVGDDPVNGVDPSGLYICDGDKSQCGALRTSLNRVESALKSGNLSNSDRSKLQGALNFYGKEGRANGVTVVFRDPSQIERDSRGKTDTAFTKPTGKRSVEIEVTSRFSTLYDDTHRLPQYARVRGDDERGNLLAHEADHGIRFQSGKTLGDYNRSVGEWEHSARERGLIVNKAFGSESVCQADNDC